ncbi:ATP-binding protein [Hydrogenophaga sp.]|uniref:ATP-binding protein n=1 Tax=Hydrogenophaga sp. TaxID=1904254 RepID=UPI0025BC5326|nr:ATP-binding protein [Hydrogenophaga sp.]MBT9465884.1 response regulator [Hydrogenophaga sp.]
MQLQRKTLSIVVLVVGVATALTAMVASYAINRVARTFEIQAALQDGEKVSRWLEQDLRQLSDLAFSHALLPNVVTAMRYEDDTYTVYSLAAENVENLRLSEIWLLDALVPGRIPVRVFADSLSQTTQQPSSNQPDGHQRWIETALSIFKAGTGPTPLVTVVREEDDVFMLAAHPVRENMLLNSPAIGVLLMARKLGHEELARVSQTLMAPVTLEVARTLQTKEISFTELSEQRGRISVPVMGVDGQPVAQLAFTVTRDMYQSITSIVYASIVHMVLLGLLLGGALVVVLNRFVLRRVKQIIRQLQSIGVSDTSSESLIRVNGDDELTSLAASINSLLKRVRADFLEQQQSSRRHESLQLQLMQSQKMEAIGRFSAGVAHDFNNSLAGTNGWIQMAKEDLPENHPSRESLEHAQKAAEYAGGLVRQLMTFSRQSQPRLEETNLSALVERSLAFVASGLMKGTEIEWVKKGASDTVLADPTQLQQVLVNLLINASDAMDGKGKITLLIHKIQLPFNIEDPEIPGSAGLQAGPYLHVRVCDEGPGIAEENLDRIFEPFFTTKAVGKGTGLGLSVAHGIMHRHGGSVGVYSEVGRGTCFHLLIPATNKPSEGSPKSPQPLTAQRGRVLLVDDDQLLRTAWAGLLQRRGWEVIQASDGEEGWQCFQQAAQDWAIVLTDLTMPELSGLALAERISKTESPPPIILVSGFLNDAQTEALKASTLFADILFKPTPADDLEAALTRAVQR